MVLSLSRSYWRNCYIKTEAYKPCTMPDSEQKISTQDRDEVNSPDDCEWNSQSKSQQSGLSSVQSLSRVRLFATPWITARQASLSITNSWSSLRLTSIESVMPSSHLILCRPLLLLPPISPSIRVLANESSLHMRWPKYWSFSFSIIPSKEIPGLISFRMDWLDLLAVQRLSRVFSNTIVQKHQFFSAQHSSQSNVHIHTWPLEKP